MKALKAAETFVKEMEKGGKKVFQDNYFGPKKNDVNGYLSVVFPEAPFQNAKPANEIKWYRPQDLNPSKPPVFLDKRAESNDVAQGEIGDCWLISGFSVMAIHQEYLIGRIPSDLVKNPKRPLTDEEVSPC